jgi:hypothetical protein
MATINRTSGDEKQSFKAIERDGWSSIYLPAIGAGVVMMTALFIAVSCSSKSDSPAAKIGVPAVPAMQAPAPTSTVATVPESPKKKVVKRHRPTIATYVNSAYGVSFTYPRNYSLQASGKEGMPVRSGFTKPGAVEIASVDMPDSGYPDTDFSSAVLNLSVNQALTADQCSQFAEVSEDASSTPTSLDDPAKAKIDVARPSTVKLGTNEFSAVERMSGSDQHQSDLKYFHLFRNGTCYEFALDIETSRKADEDLAQVDRGQVFNRLEKILATARIKEVPVQGNENADKLITSDVKPAPAGTVQPVAPTMATETAQPSTPEQK